jgi:hypothetical protein
MWFHQCDNAHALERLYDSAEGLDQLRLFEITLTLESHVRLRLALPRFPDHPPSRWNSEATEAQVVISCWFVEDLELGGWRGESAGTLALERVDHRLRVSFVSSEVRLEATCAGARIDGFEAYATYPD